MADISTVLSCIPDEVSPTNDICGEDTSKTNEITQMTLQAETAEIEMVLGALHGRSLLLPQHNHRARLSCCSVAQQALAGDSTSHHQSQEALFGTPARRSGGQRRKCPLDALAIDSTFAAAASSSRCVVFNPRTPLHALTRLNSSQMSTLVINRRLVPALDRCLRLPAVQRSMTPS